MSATLSFGPSSELDSTAVKTREHGQMMSFNRLVTASVTLIVGILVFNQVADSLPNTSNGAIDSSVVNSTIESAYQLAPVVLIVLVAALILAQVSGFNR